MPDNPIETIKPPSKLFTDHYVSAFFFLIALFAAAAVNFIRPIILDIKETNAEITLTQQSLRDKGDVLSVLEKSLAASQTIPKDTLDRVELALPTDPGFPYILADMSAAAQRNGVRINNINFSDPKVNATPNAKVDLTKGTVLPVNVTMNLHANRYLEVKRMLADMESNLRVMDVTGLGLSASPDGGFDYTVQIRSYIFLPPGVKAPTP